MSFPGVPLEDPILEAERQRLIVRTRQWRGVYFQSRAAPPPSDQHLEDDADGGAWKEDIATPSARRLSILPTPVHLPNTLPCPLVEDCSSPSSQGASLSCDVAGSGALGKRCQCVSALLRVAVTSPGGIYAPTSMEGALHSNAKIDAVGWSVCSAEPSGSLSRREKKRRRRERVLD